MIPKIDSEIGITVYSTKLSGSGGTIKNQNDDFIVSEIITEKAHAMINEDSGYAVYKLKKNGIDTTHALNEIFKKYGVRLKALGLKDSSAITEQFDFTTNTTRRDFEVQEQKYGLK